MDIIDIVSEDYVEFEPSTPVSKLVGTFEDPDVKGVVVYGDKYEGVVTRKQLADSHHQPREKVGSLVWHVPRIRPDADIRDVAKLMIDSEAQLLPVFEGDRLVGVITVDHVLRKVNPYLSDVTVKSTASLDLVTVPPGGTVGEALHQFREHQITHIPVIDRDDAVGIVSLYDLMGLTIRAEQQSQGGDAAGTDPFGGNLGAGRTRRGGFGAREGELARMLDIPVRDVMISPVHTVSPGDSLEEAVDAMFETGGSSLVVTDNGSPHGIITKTDVLAALTWEAGGNRAIQVYGTDLLTDMSYEKVIAMVEKFANRDHGMSIIDAKIHLHEHDETLRGIPLLLARIRLHTDNGLYIASGEGFGAAHALNEARDVLERQIIDQKTYGQSKKSRPPEYFERRLGWSLEGA